MKTKKTKRSRTHVSSGQVRKGLEIRDGTSSGCDSIDLRSTCLLREIAGVFFIFMLHIVKKSTKTLSVKKKFPYFKFLLHFQRFQNLKLWKCNIFKVDGSTHAKILRDH